MKKYIFESNFYSILRRTFNFSWFILASLICVASFYEFLQDRVITSAWSFGQITISSTWILLNIVAVLYYFVNWKVQRHCGWSGSFFHVANFLLSEFCVWLSFLKFYSTDAFYVDDRQENKNKIVVSGIIWWFITVFAHACMNSLTHLIMIYHHHKTNERIPKYTATLRALFGLFCIMSFVPAIIIHCLSGSQKIWAYYFNLHPLIQFLLSVATVRNFAHSSLGNEFLQVNRFTRLDWRYHEHVESMGITFWGLFKFFRGVGLGLVGLDMMIHSEFYKMIKEQDFNRDIAKSFQFVPFIACAHVFSIIRESLLKYQLEFEFLETKN